MKLKVLSYNIHKGLNFYNTKLVLDPIKKLVQELDIDLVFFQEVSGENNKLKKRFQDYPDESQFEYFADSCWNHYAYAQNAVYDHGHHGNLILSKYPILNWENINISTNSLECRGLLCCKIEIPELKVPLSLFCTHLNLFEHSRKKQLAKIQTILSEKTEADSKIIMAGDFNDWNLKGSSFIEKNTKLNDVFFDKNKTFAKTFPSFFPILCLDRIYTKNIKTQSAVVLNEKCWRDLSDHLPLLAELEIV